MRDIYKALVSLYPGTKWYMNGDLYEGLVWSPENEIPKPSLEVLEAECDRLEQIWNNTEYRRQRQLEYPSIGDQLDALFHAGVFPPEMAAKIQAIKDKYPKG